MRGKNNSTHRVRTFALPRRLSEARALRAHQLIDRCETLLGQPAQFGIGAILNRMRNEDAVRMEAERLTLRARGSFEDFGGNETAGYSATVEIFDVMQTARRARSSVGQAFDHNIAFAGNFLQ